MTDIRTRPDGVRSRAGGWSTPVMLPGRMADLAGPCEGLVRLPLRLHSSDAGTAAAFDVGDPGSRRNLYAIVMEHAVDAGDLADWINRDLLVEDWPDLWLSPHVRRAWLPLMAARPAIGVPVARAGLDAAVEG